MTDKDLKSLYEKSEELTPPPALKGKILAQATAELNGKQKVKTHFFSRRIWKKLVPLAVCLVIMLSLIGGAFGLKYENYQTVYIDVNPSVALQMNRFDRVNDVETLNKDAETALDGVKLKGLSAEKALEKVLSVYEKKGYLSNGAELYISAYSKKNKSAEKLLEKLAKKAEQIKGDKEYNVNIVKLSKEEKNIAKEYGVSPSKYQLICQIIEKYPHLTLDELKDKSMKELKSMANN
ncbi:MAG: hypothetical protein J6A38_01545 [Clostridia bacterium]|nr:hypothetical protein [Clostridia bacterium]